MVHGQFLMSWQDWVVNFCYLLLAVSYLVSDLYWLRVLAIGALGLEAVYYYFGSATPSWVGFGWATVFVSINLVQLALMTRERLAVRMSEREQWLHRRLFTELTPVQFNRFLKIGTWREVEGGTLLTVRGELVPELLLIADGTVEVIVGGEVIALQQAGSFVGELSFISGERASADVAAAEHVVLLAIAKPALDQLLNHDRAIATALLRVMGHGMAAKLKERHPRANQG